ncbi:hypothetical protein NADFUDRAFT_4557, partial [Nadsonia fulvescens var. elongata DSM 6958]
PVTHPTSDTSSPLLLIQSDSVKQYLIGQVCEGTQRSILENKIRIPRIENIFLTGRLTWDSMGGLPGFILTVADMGKVNLNLITGNDNIKWACDTWRSFIFRFGLNLGAKSVEDLDSFIDSNINITPVLITPKVSSVTTSTWSTSSLSAETEELESRRREEYIQTVETIFTNMFPATGKIQDELANQVASKLSRLSLPSLTSESINITNKVSTCYIVQEHNTRGKFLPQLAKMLGIKPGIAFSQLTNGKSVLATDGTTLVHPHQVMEPERVNPRILVIDCPDEEYIDSIVNCQHWRRLLSDASKVEVGVVYHFLGKTINPFEPDSAYLEFIRSFPASTMHFISHHSYCPDNLSFQSSSYLIAKLNHVNPENFSLPHSDAAILIIPEIKNDSGETLKVFPLIKNEPLKINPICEYEYDSETGSAGKNYGKEDWEKVKVNEIAPITSRLPEILQNCAPSLTNNPFIDEVETITLGTGSAIPGKYRNVASNLIRVPNAIDLTTSAVTSYTSLVLDCGEGTLGTMKRVFGPEETDKVFKELRLLYLSHLHADHHLGSISVLKEWVKKKAGTQEADLEDENDTLYILGPWQYENFLKEWGQLERELGVSLKHKMRYISLDKFMADFSSLPELEDQLEESLLSTETKRSTRVRSKSRPVSPFFQKQITRMYESLKIKKITTCWAIHCEWAYCVTVEFESGFKLSYSGDTRPSNMFARIGQGTNLMIHEATFENGLELEAKKKKHSTIGEAIRVGKRMKAENILLTHFSQRYPKMPEVRDNK